MQIPKLEDTYRLRCNVGRTEALLRVFTGLAILGAGVYFQSWVGLIGLVPLLTGLLKWCPLYRLLGVSTCTSRSKWNR
ncbi:YgaP family membrane protein [Desulfocurvibacter africanus]|uniref:YgaP family membrane protein n=1 Tax=Desulfocurvibacter africanus TaxID=873 RepID=UPI00040E1885|nr:DUF2892 domain-containing protein [Desulfocurvibacter africanus]